MKSTHRVVVAAGAAALFMLAAQVQAADTLAPWGPESLQATSRTCNSIDLTWAGGNEPEADEVQSGLARYEIRSTTNNARVYNGTGESGSAPWTYLQTSGTARYARISGLQPGSVYSFAITAIDLAGNRSAARSFPLATVLKGAPQCSDVTPPSLPDIQASSFSALSCHEAAGNIAASTDAGSGIEGYFVYVDGIRSYFSRPDVRDAHLRALLPGREYKISLQAIDVAGNLSAVSAPITLRMPACTAPVSGLLSVWVQAFYFKGESVPAYDHAEMSRTLLFDADGTNFSNPLNVDQYLRETSYGKLGLKSPSVFVRWTQLPRTAAEYRCTLMAGEFRGCDTIAIANDARTAHAAHESIARAFPLRVYFVDRMSHYVWSDGGSVTMGIGVTEIGRTSLQAAPLILDSLMKYMPYATTTRCTGPGTGSPDGAGNVPKFSHDAGFGCLTGFVDFSVRVDEDSRQMRHQAALMKYWNGWISEAETLRTTPPYTGTIGAVDRKHTARKLLLIPMAPAGTSSSVNTPTYSLEYVSGAGLNAGQQTGLVVRYFGNALPSGGALQRVDVLSPGESFVDPYRGIKIELLQTISNLLAQVRVCNTTPGVATDGSFSSVCLN